MSHVEFKKRTCRPVDFRGQGPFVLYLSISALYNNICLNLNCPLRGAIPKATTMVKDGTEFRVIHFWIFANIIIYLIIYKRCLHAYPY